MLIDWFTVGAQAVNFLILVWLMKRFLYGPVLAAIDAREKKIAGELKEAADAKASAGKEREDLRVQTETLQGRREELLRAASVDAEAQHQRLLEDAHREVQELRVKSLAALTAEQTELQLEIVSRARREAFALTRKTLAGLADTTLEDRMLEVFIHRVQDLNEVQKVQLIAPPVDTRARSAVLRSAFELTPAQQTHVTAAFREWPCGGATLTFETAPELVSGVELIVDGQKLAWNVTAYLADVEEKTEALLIKAPEIPISTGDVKHAA
jgi:F-type H+-transporting ATPase subunit b